jgi:DNA-binding transcriptional LysR family regulator
MELPSNEAVRAAVEAGLGATAISASVAAPGIEAGLLRQLPVKLPEREFHLLAHRNRPRSRLADALLATLAEAGPSRPRPPGRKPRAR